MKTCFVSDKCPWGHPSQPNECGYKKEMSENDFCYNLYITLNCGGMITNIKKASNE